MRKFFIGVLALALALAGVVPAIAQQNAGAYVTQTGNRADAAVFIATSTSSAATLTLTPNPGESVYVYSVHISNCAGASAVTAAAVTTMTTTAIGGGTTPVWTIGSGVAAGLCQPTVYDVYPTGLKGNSPGVAVTFVLPTFATNQTLRVQVAWRSAP